MERQIQGLDVRTRSQVRAGDYESLLRGMERRLSSIPESHRHYAYLMRICIGEILGEIGDALRS